jgi:hypothetical protein
MDLNNTNTFNMSIDDLTDRNSNGRSFLPPESLSNSSLHGSGGRQQPGDKSVQSYELEDSVTAIEWSAADAWVFAALSFNGTFCINMVPSKEKYRILL